MADAEFCDVCVVGTGAGGGVLAYELAKAGLNVVSLEQGGRLPADHFRTTDRPGAATDFGVRAGTVWPSDPHDSLFVHELFAGADTGSAVQRPGGFRQYQIHAVDGLQSLWNGVSVRFSPGDLAGWPFGYDELAGHYAAVERRITVCGTAENIPELPDGDYIPPKPLRPSDRMIVDAVRRLGEQDAYAIPNRKAINTRAGMETSCISTGICTSGCPVGSVYKFSARLLPEIANLPNYELRTHAKVVRLLRDGDERRVEAVEYIDTRTGETRRLRAGLVVLAAGAIETPRILFNSADERDPAGLANRSGQLGLRLQDNPKAVLSTSLWKLWGKRRNYDIGYGDLLILMARTGLPDGEAFPFIGHAIHGIPDAPHYLGGLAPFPAPVKRELARLMFHSYVTLGLFCAGDPNPANRVRPGRQLDRFGVPQVEIDFTVSARTRDMMQAMAVWGRRVLRKASATSIYETSDNSGTGIHYAGTTPLSADPAQGVINADLRSHDIDNLYICDGGVIPTLPDKHLTLTIMALSHRLGRHIAARSGRDQLQAA
ncbi:GMC family oxidoreductase [Camelimonas fluminis]|uniref:GMC oxidoreductase n=1 Tax=Camelimonas fluminis TaxID=1576911 RepID=A0ABV7UDF3_9HYPH|nr:GMC family oxidoreductase [Camelimonas fluminis]GHE66357.1 GMC family oxidoreductase [Camelimonas fluminis]